MKVILVIIPIISLIFAALNGRMAELSASIISKSGEAVELVFSLCGIMCFWCGLMRVAERAGLTEKLARLLSPIVCALFRGLPRGSRAVGLITMNLAANILGLGNASTPLGIAAMRELAELENADGRASDNMILLAVLNTASLQVIPATAAALRSANGAENPFDILPCVWIVSVYAAVVAVLAAKIMGRIARKRGDN
ncbi:MAG: spore maturation protein A [Lachnospiraceae bacterium]|nr:spore maturation protein A [Ruminococcus sp.]MCM1275928.1 spore maturation protein A [Lachnospiraceae bacterium]